MKSNRFTALWIGLIVAILAFAMFFTGIAFILDKTMPDITYFAFGVVSLMMGIVSAVLFMLKPRAAFYIFEAGLLASFLVMFRFFSDKYNTFGDLGGIFSFFIVMLTALGAAILVQFVIYSIRRRKLKATDADGSHTAEAEISDDPDGKAAINTEAEAKSEAESEVSPDQTETENNKNTASEQEEK